MRHILFAHLNPHTGKIAYVIKKIPDVPEDAEITFLDISEQECETLGVDRIIYPTNHYEDDIPYVWMRHPAHIASLKIPLHCMRQLLLSAMKRATDAEITDKILLIQNCKRTKREWACRRNNILTQLRFTPAESPTLLTLTDTIGDTRHWFIIQCRSPDILTAGKYLHQMLQEQYRTKEVEAQKQLLQLEETLNVLLGEIASSAQDDFPD